MRVILFEHVLTCFLLMVKIVCFLDLAYNKVSLCDQPNHVTQNTQILDNCVSEVVLEKKKVFAFLGNFLFTLPNCSTTT